MSCEYCSLRHGCTIRQRYEDGTAVVQCGMDFGRDKSETVILERQGKGKFVVRYDLPVEPNAPSGLNLFDEDFKRMLSDFFAKRIKRVEAEIYKWIESNPICYTNPCDAILDGIYGVTTPATFPRPDVQAERYDVSEFFIQFPLGLPVELKGIAPDDCE